MSWKRFHRGECPVCGGTRKDCRQSTTTGLIHCRDINAAPNGYIFRGYDSIGFGMWTDKAEAEAWTEEKHREWQETRRVEREREKARCHRLLSACERDTAIRQILVQLELGEQHRAQLRLRGMTEEQIESGMYRSVQKWQRLRFRANDNLAGVRHGGKGLQVPASGILCPIPNHKGEFVGWQLRLDEPGELPKYLWASPESKRRKNGPSVHLRNGELPLAFIAPSNEKHEVVSQWFKDNNTNVIPVALTEGIAFKPTITANRLGIPAIGASGGNFASSPATLKVYLEHIQAAYADNKQNAVKIQPILFADAGCLANNSILKVYSNTVNQLREFGFQTKIAWWGQGDKSATDIDQINDTVLASIELLTYRDFLWLVKKNQRDRQVEGIQRQLQSLTYKPNVRFNQRYLPELASIMPMEGIVALKSPKGSGKSVQIKKIVERARSRGMKVISLTPRRALGREQSLKWDIEWGGDGEVSGIHPLTRLEKLETVGICWDSLWKLLSRDWSHTLVVIDESELALIHLLLSSTCFKKRPSILRTLEVKLGECLTNGGMLLIADADMSDLSVNYFQSLATEAPTFIITNDYQSAETQWQVEFYTGKKDRILASLMTELATPVIERNEQGEAIERQRRIAIPTDSRDQAEALERYIKESYPHLLNLRIDSTTTETDEGRAFVERPNQKILELQPDVLIYTPSMGAGVSIDVPWFDQMYAFFNGVVEPSQCRQMLSRVRAAIARTIWCRNRGRVDGCTSFLPEELKSRLFSFHQQSSILIDVMQAIAGDDPTDLQIRQAYDAIWNQETQAWDNPHLDLYCNLVARKNYGLYYLASELR
ncbi:MAG: plasmid replication protein, CyRepA1 family [Xenococcaceae cyanobacterium]